jgi:heme-degrading monooxygenase HmoA
LGLGHDVAMTIIKINAIRVPEEAGDEVARRFGERAGAVEGTDGFEGFELLRPSDDRNTWLVVTRWRDDEAFEAWTNSPAFAHGHREAKADAGTQKPMGLQAELWGFTVAMSAPAG